MRRHLGRFDAHAAAAWLMVRHADDYALSAGLQQLADGDGLSWPDDGEVEEFAAEFVTA